MTVGARVATIIAPTGATGHDVVATTGGKGGYNFFGTSHHPRYASDTAATTLAEQKLCESTSAISAI